MTGIRSRLVPYFLLGPGILWLILFFVVPMYFMGRLSLETGVFPSYQFDWNFSNYSDTLSAFDTQFLRAFSYSAAATAIALVIAYPLAYAIAFRGGKWKNALLLAVVAPFFTTYLIRTLAWETILSDNGVVVDTLKAFGLVADDGRLLATKWAVIAGLTYNFLPFMVLPIYASLERIDATLIDAAPVGARRRRRDLAHIHSRDRRLHQRPVPGWHQHGDDRQRDSVALPQAD